MEDAHAQKQRAVQFFWTCLTLATCASVAGNITHAVLNAPHSTAVIAACTAVVVGINRYQNGPKA